MTTIKKGDKRDKVGKLSTDLILKDPETNCPVEQSRENLTDYEDNFWKCVDAHKRLPQYHNKDFYIVVLSVIHKNMPNVPRSRFFGRLSCPTPDYGQAVYKYHSISDDAEFLWIVPDRSTCESFMFNQAYVPKSHLKLLEYVILFKNGSLLQWAKELNGEKDDRNIIIATS